MVAARRAWLSSRQADSLAEFEDGVWLAEFAPLAEAAFVPQALASTLDISEQPGRALIDTLADHFLHLHALLLFDNCEHLINACAQLADVLLKTCPDLWILATSREILDIPGEAVFVVPPLSLPEPQPQRSPASGQSALMVYDQSEAVRLFVERATIGSPSLSYRRERHVDSRNMPPPGRDAARHRTGGRTCAGFINSTDR